MYGRYSLFKAEVLIAFGDIWREGFFAGSERAEKEAAREKHREEEGAEPKRVKKEKPPKSVTSRPFAIGGTSHQSAIAIMSAVGKPNSSYVMAMSLE